MPLHIARLEIENFRNFGRLVIAPFPATAVIVGENNVGKTNLLYALRLIFDPDLPDSARRLRAEDIFDGSGGVSQAVTVRVAVELADFGDDPGACATLYDCYINDDPPRARLEYRFEPREQVIENGDTPSVNGEQHTVASLKAADYDWRLLGGPEDNMKLVRIEPRRYIGMRVLPALRDASDELTRRRSPLRELLDRLTPGEGALTSAAQEVNAAMDKLLTDESVGSLQDAIRGQTAQMVGPALPVSPTLGIAPTVPDQLLRQIRLFTDADRRRGLNDTSVGTANLLYLALLMEAVRQRRSSSENVATILGVEEPEAHLHVQVQRRLFGYLLRHEPALLLTSHSPHIAAVSPLASLVLLRATPDGSVARTTTEAGLTEQQQADLERYLDATRAELLFARLAILVEGDAERYVLPALAHVVEFDLDEYGISIISVQGTDFAPFRTLIGQTGLDIPNVVVTDGDRVLDPAPVTSDGLLRGLNLLSTDNAQELIREFPEHPRRDGHKAISTEQDRSIREELENRNVYVGDVTLEIDLTRMMPGSVDKALSDFLGPQATMDQHERLETIRLGRDTLSVRNDFLSRIEGIGKGRFAQRLAEYIQEENLSTIRNSTRADLPASYIMRALDRASRLVRDRGLFDEPAEENDTGGDE